MSSSKYNVTLTNYARGLAQDISATLANFRAPEVVVCSFPPAGNSFEQAVFATPSVQLYIVINSRLAVGSGNRLA